MGDLVDAGQGLVHRLVFWLTQGPVEHVVAARALPDSLAAFEPVHVAAAIDLGEAAAATAGEAVDLDMRLVVAIEFDLLAGAHVEGRFARRLDLHQDRAVVAPDALEEPEIDVGVLEEDIVHQRHVQPFLAAPIARQLLADRLARFETIELMTDRLQFFGNVGHHFLPGQRAFGVKVM
jgi:hypothetical protein